MFNIDFFIEHKRTILSVLNSPIYKRIRRSLFVDDMENKIVDISPNGYHALQDNGSIAFVARSSNIHAEHLSKNYRRLWEMIHAWDMKFANRFIPSLNLGFDTYTSQPAEASANDTFLSTSDVGGNFGTRDDFFIGEDVSSSNIERSLIKYDLSSIPSGVDINSVTHSLWLFLNSASNVRTARMYRVLRDWIELQATWNVWKTGSNWTTAGCGSAGNDYVNTSLADFTYATAESLGEKQYIFNTSGLLSVKDMVDGVVNNYGWIIRMDVENNDRHVHRASAWTTAGERPKLVIVWQYPAPSVIFFI